MPLARWSPGDVIVLRFVGHDDGIASGFPQVVVEDSDARLVLFQPAGVLVENRCFGPNLRAVAIPLGTLGNEGHLPETWVPPMHMLRVIPPGAEHAVEMHFDAGTSAPFAPWHDGEGWLRGYKVNLQSRYVRTSIGIDTTDNRLDLVMGSELRWQRKDDAQLTAAVEAGLTFVHEAAAFRAEAERVAADIEARRAPFDGSWSQWRPDPRWPLPALPPRWHLEAGVEIDLNRVRPLSDRPMA